MLREVECNLDLLIIRDASLKRVRVLENPGEVIVVDGASGLSASEYDQVRLIISVINPEARIERAPRGEDLRSEGVDALVP